MKVNKFLKHTIGWLRLGLIALLVQGCSSFEQDFSRSPIGEISILMDKSEYDAVQLEKLHIPVTITGTSGKAGRYAYRWKALTNDAVYILSDKKDLDTIIDLPPQQYNIQYTVTDLDNGLEFNKQLFLNVNGAFYEGWLVSHNQGGKGKLAFIRDDDMVFPDPVGQANNLTFPENLKATFYTQIPYRAKYASIASFTGTEIFRFDPNTFKLTGKSEEVFMSPNGYDGIAWDSGLRGIDQYFINKGEIHVGMGDFYPEDILKPYTPGLGGDYDLFPAVISSTSYSTFFYDNKYKRFLVAPAFERALTVASNGSNSTVSILNMSNVGKTMIAVEKGRTTYNSGVFYCVMEDSEGRYVAGINNVDPSLFQKVLDSACPDFSKAKLFTASGLFQHMYYAVGNKIYLYNIVANAAELLYSFPSSHTITDIEIKRKTSRTLAVATWDGTAGNMNLFDINDLGQFVDEAPKKVFGNLGHIVHISNK
ncbi:PKD-like family protein [Sphingobacterium nematocida]|uniref:PKD-like family protein n=1 Tax=Sphingobacterium nematocida TaxID=1513896 RepID=A0A1T5AXI0_9SPHI|nr:PKD-like family lipoprotein [Sphingobacterium nematocida]SKB39675.1 PKD-like family protein [Sphingobacterium nematocida]